MSRKRVFLSIWVLRVSEDFLGGKTVDYTFFVFSLD